MIEDGIVAPNRTYKTWVVDLVSGNRVLLHSLWELSLYESAKENNIDLSRDHGIRIKYTDFSSGEEHNYIPDFWCDSIKTLYEVKGRFTNRDSIKFSAAIEWCNKNHAQFIVISDKRFLREYFSLNK